MLPVRSARPSWLELSLPIRSGLPVWPGDPPVVVAAVQCLADGASSNLTGLAMSAHAGTHVDAPRHVLAAGAGVDALPAATLLGPALVLDVAGRGPIVPSDLALLPRGVRRLLLRANPGLDPAALALPERFRALTPEAAALLVRRGVRLVGIDAPSVDPPEAVALPAHHVLLGAGVVVVEGLLLRGVPGGRGTLVVAPLRLVEADGAPARVWFRPIG